MSETTSELDALLREAPTETEEAGIEGEEEHPKTRRRRRMTIEKGVNGLNLTAMMDMFTIILVFLLKNYATTPENVTLSDELRPPQSTAKIPMDVALIITVTSKAILVDDKIIAEFAPDGSVVGDDPNARNAPIAPLSTILETKVADMKAMEARGGPVFDGKLLVVADMKVTYATLMRVLYTAGIAQFTQYKLVVRSAPGTEAPPAQ
jgi:biopolymer transport protein ExbD